MRDLRDELRPSGDESRGSGSLWNIALPMPLSSLSRAEVDALLDQYCAASGVPWRREAREELWQKTHGQPWLVCRIAYELDEQLGCPRLDSPPAGEGPRARDGAGPPAVATVRAAAAQLLEEDCVHLLSVSDLLLGRRDAQELVARLLAGEEVALCRANEAQSYLLDTGVILPSESGRFIELHNPIYEGYLGRWLPEQH